LFGAIEKTSEVLIHPAQSCLLQLFTHVVLIRSGFTACQALAIGGLHNFAARQAPPCICMQGTSSAFSVYPLFGLIGLMAL
jgi:hypothetical protein